MDRDTGSASARSVESRVRLGGVLLLVAAVLAVYVVELLMSRGGSGANEFRLLDWSWRVLAPAGAMLIAVSLAMRAWTGGANTAFLRAQIGAGLTLLTLGLLNMTIGTSVLAAVDDYLGPTGRAGAHLVGFAARVINVTALPLGVALLTTLPLLRLAGTGAPHRQQPAAPTDRVNNG